MKITPLDRGIEDIHWQAQESTDLAQTSSLLPGDAPLESLLDELLASPAFVDRLAESLAPQISHRHILHPGTFHGLTQQLPERLHAAAKAAETPQAQRKLLAALDVLEEQRHNTEILDAYRKLLLKG